MSLAAQEIPAAQLMPGMTIAQSRRALAAAFRDAGLASPELDARVIVGHALALDHTRLTIESGRSLGSDEARTINALAARRLMREPVARIVGVKEFWGLELRITEATLVPRPETETLVEAALAAIDSGGPRTRAMRIADLGTGSGALLLALLSELPNAVGIGTDISHAALEVAQDNAGRLRLLPRAQFIAGDFGAALSGGFDAVVSNPPYIASGDIAEVAPEVRHDPRCALDGGADGLVCYRAIVGDANRLLAPNGYLVVELGIDQEPAVAALFRGAGLLPMPARCDLAGVPRTLCAQIGALSL